jgi:hypothetical protein
VRQQQRQRGECALLAQPQPLLPPEVCAPLLGPPPWPQPLQLPLPPLPLASRPRRRAAAAARPRLPHQAVAAAAASFPQALAVCSSNTSSSLVAGLARVRSRGADPCPQA